MKRFFFAIINLCSDCPDHSTGDSGNLPHESEGLFHGSRKFCGLVAQKVTAVHGGRGAVSRKRQLLFHLYLLYRALLTRQGKINALTLYPLIVSPLMESLSPKKLDLSHLSRVILSILCESLNKSHCFWRHLDSNDIHDVITWNQEPELGWFQKVF
jgi:hypothetical protein